MIESHLKAGRQNYDPDNVEYGVSITDGCLSLAETIPLLEKLNSLEY
jgi:3-deoxy-7-phosphoheptulonate synthase